MRFLPALSLLLLTACGGEDPLMIEKAPLPELSAEAVENLAPDPRDYPFLGLWADSQTDCTREPGSGENAPILITPDYFTDAAGKSPIARIIELKGEGRYEAILTGVGQQGEPDWDAYLRLSGSSLMFERENAASVTWTRCPTSSSVN
ncbi:hypothetical protein [Parvularcula sp. LCG005]|uniref:hypothetical protein n=1 Tax=Parvularcula sp. LCG005 TaxID=3078805 RepID=UPI002943EC78|nr:hypothetical protein [Parvularcula sp. LCG005]WOI52824.1 hypothetical protein RUI03_11765 [Parvularcula sp. LCG005]